MNFIERAEKRCSIRSYTSDPISETTLTDVLLAPMARKPPATGSTYSL